MLIVGAVVTLAVYVPLAAWLLDKINPPPVYRYPFSVACADPEVTIKAAQTYEVGKVLDTVTQQAVPASVTETDSDGFSFRAKGSGKWAFSVTSQCP